MKFIDRSQLFAIMMTILLYLIFQGIQINQQNVIQLHGQEPYMQKFFTDYGEPDELLNQRVQIFSGEFVLPNASLLRTTTHVVTEGARIDSDQLFLYGGLVLRAIYLLLVMMIVMTMTHKVQYAIVVACVVFTSPFFVFRSPALIPENVAVLFFLLMIWGFEQYKRTGRIVFMLVVVLSVVGNVIYEPTSVIINGVIIFSYALVFLFNEAPRKIEVTFISALIALILLLPLFGTLVNVVSATLTGFNDNSIWSQYSQISLTPTVNVFLELVGYPVVLFSVLGIVTIVWRQLRNYLHLLVMLGFMLLLMLNVSPRVTLDPGRMQTYIYMVLILISSVYIALLFSRTSRLVRMMLIVVLVSYGLAVMLVNPPWQRLTADELDFTATVNRILSENPDDVLFVDTDAMSLAVLIEHPEQLCAYWEPVFQWYVPPASGNIPNCSGAEYRMTASGANLPEFRIVRQIDDLALYQRVVDA